MGVVGYGYALGKDRKETRHWYNISILQKNAVHENRFRDSKGYL